MITYTMNPSKVVLDNKLAELERASNCSEREIYLEITKLRNDDIEGEHCTEWLYESMAFAFHRKLHRQEKWWGNIFWAFRGSANGRRQDHREPESYAC